METIGTTTGNSPSLEELLADLYSVHEGVWDSIKRRAKVLYEYAKKQEEGVIVELGTYLGYGAFSLAYGALAGYGQQVYTVDDYIERTGWAGEVYKPEYQDKFYNNWYKMVYYKQMKLNHVAVSAEEAGKTMRGVGLLFVDVSPTIPTIHHWGDSIMSGGTVLFRDTLTRSLGYDKQVENAVSTGKWVVPEEQVNLDPYFLLLRKV